MTDLDHPVEATLRRADGRRIAYTRSGEPEGRPVLFCHGTPGARLFRPPDPRLPAELGVELVTADRPGYGRSTRRPGRTLLDWADDVAALADELSWGRFSVAGVSGGGPHAMACAVAMPERIAAVGVVSSVAPFWPGALDGMLPTTRRAFQFARWAPWLLVFEARRLGRHPERFLDQVRGQLPECDRRVVDRPEVAAVMAVDAAEALAGDEVAREMRLLRRAWGFAPRDVTVPVLLWHGESDRNIPVAHGRRLAATLPDCRPTFVPAAGHYVIFDHWAPVLRGVAAAS